MESSARKSKNVPQGPRVFGKKPRIVVAHKLEKEIHVFRGGG